MNTRHKKLPGAVWFVSCAHDSHTTKHYGPYVNKGTARGQATRMSNKGWATTLVPFYGPIHERIEVYPEEQGNDARGTGKTQDSESGEEQNRQLTLLF